MSSEEEEGGEEEEDELYCSNCRAIVSALPSLSR